jgi:hypothetical protein
MDPNYRDERLAGTPEAVEALRTEKINTSRLTKATAGNPATSEPATTGIPHRSVEGGTHSRNAKANSHEHQGHQKQPATAVWVPTATGVPTAIRMPTSAKSRDARTVKIKGAERTLTTVETPTIVWTPATAGAPASS